MRVDGKQERCVYIKSEKCDVHPEFIMGAFQSKCV